jgi:hypothetical protein
VTGVRYNYLGTDVLLSYNDDNVYALDIMTNLCDSVSTAEERLSKALSRAASIVESTIKCNTLIFEKYFR